MDERRCKTCKWWQQQDEDRKKFRNVKQCKSPHLKFAGGRKPVREEEPWADQILLSDDDYGKLPEEPIAPGEASVMDGSGYWGALFTGPEFGCTNHEDHPA